MAKIAIAGLSAARFLRRYWQKRPLLARAALPDLGEFANRETLIRLAAREDLESRLVIRDGRRWRVRHGPLPARAFDGLGGRKWSLLVQGVERALPAAARLLQRFAFIPCARLDDVMVSFAPPGGGVGPHYDSYDVFLAQGAGSRRWRIGAVHSRELVAGAPLRILRRFDARREIVTRTGDVLYLPPYYGHDGVAITDCVTISIGFRAPSAQELGVRFLEHLQEHIALEGQYEDPDLEPQRRPAWLSPAMVGRAARLLRGIRWSQADIAECLGCLLTEPRPQVVFARPLRPLSPRAFETAAARHGVRLSPASRMLFHRDRLFVNGDVCRIAGRPAAALRRLADRRRLPAGVPLARPVLERLYEWYRAGYILTGTGED